MIIHILYCYNLINSETSELKSKKVSLISDSGFEFDKSTLVPPEPNSDVLKLTCSSTAAWLPDLKPECKRMIGTVLYTHY